MSHFSTQFISILKFVEFFFLVIQFIIVDFFKVELGLTIELGLTNNN